MRDRLLVLADDAEAVRRIGAASARVVRPVFVGRDAEVRVLDEELARGIGGEGRVVLLVGEEGIGKTSLALEMTRRARARGCTVLWGQCHETGGAPAYWPWVQILRGYVKTADPESLRRDVGDGVAAIGWMTPALHERSAEVAPHDTAHLTRFHVVDAVTQFLRRVATHRPLMLVIDDLHQADGDSLHLLRLFATESTDLPVLIIGAYREDARTGPVPEDLIRIASQPLTTVLRLPRFELSDVRCYLEAATTMPSRDDLARAIHAKTEGHPLFMAEVTRLLAADGRLAEPSANGEFRLAIPATRRQIIAERLARLSDPCRKLLEIAAVAGHDFQSELVVRVAAAEWNVAVDGELKEALSEQILAASDDDPGAYRFAHVLIREVLYDSIADRNRRDFHRRVGEALEEASRSDGADLRGAETLAAIAHHYREAASDTIDLQHALEWTVAAGDRAALVMAHAEAARQYEGALRIVERTRLGAPLHIVDLLLKRSEALWRAGDITRAHEAARRALVLAKQTGEPTTVAVAALRFAGRLPGFGSIVSDAEVVSELEQALALLPSSAIAVRTQVMARLAEELACSPHRGAERALGQQAIELARRIGEPTILAAVLRTTQWSVWTPDAVERRRHLATEIVELAEGIGDRMLALDGQLLRLWSALEHGETDVAWRQLSVCEGLERDLHLPYYAWVTAAARAALHHATGRLDEAGGITEQAFRDDEHANDPTMTLFIGVRQAYTNARRGRFDLVAEWLRDILTSVPALASTVECVLVLAYARTEQHDRARTELTALTADLDRVPRNAMWLLNMTFLAEACMLLGDGEAAGHLYPQLAPFTPYNVVLPPIFVQGPVAHYMGGLAALIGNEMAARRHYEDALALERRTGSRQWLAPTQVVYGQLLVRCHNPGDVERGAGLVAAGRALAEELAIEPVVRDADATVIPRLQPEAARGLFRQGGDQWDLEFHGERAVVAHRVGMTYLRCLLERPGVPVSAIELASIGGEAVFVDREGGMMVDRRAAAEVRRRLAEIDADIAACARRSAVVSTDVLRERSECAAYVATRCTEMISTAERARSGVTKAIGRAIKAIGAVHPALAHHLERHIETGRLCAYVPEVATPITFEF